MKKLLAFDLDKTLADLGKGISEQNIKLLRRLEDKGYKIAIVSGKPTYYLSGFLRQVGLKKPILVGENGAVIQIGIDLPPKENYITSYSPRAKESIKSLEEAIREKYPDLFFQPNLVGLTPFPRSEEEFEVIEEIIEAQKEDLNDIKVYRHVDSFDIVPENIDKKAGLQALSQILGIPQEDMIAVGDGVNDYPMFEYAGKSIGINVEQPEKVDEVFTSITDALEYLNTIDDE